MPKFQRGDIIRNTATGIHYEVEGLLPDDFPNISISGTIFDPRRQKSYVLRKVKHTRAHVSNMAIVDYTYELAENTAKILYGKSDS